MLLQEHLEDFEQCKKSILKVLRGFRGNWTVFKFFQIF